jgi:hypothetical protein
MTSSRWFGIDAYSVTNQQVPLVLQHINDIIGAHATGSKMPGSSWEEHPKRRLFVRQFLAADGRRDHRTAPENTAFYAPGIESASAIWRLPKRGGFPTSLHSHS